MNLKSRIIESESYKYQDLIGKKCVDFLANIDPRASKDMDALKTWQLHFEQQGIPYYVAAVSEKQWALYKEKRCDYVKD